MASDPPINWDAITPQGRIEASGEPRGRHVSRENSPAPILSMWKCPACGVENSGVLELGCPHCGSGGGARKAEAPKSNSTVQYSTPSTPPLSRVPIDIVQKAFQVWAAMPRQGVPTFEDAFFSGWLAAAHYKGDATTVETSPTTDQTGTPRSRTLAAALAMFIEQVLVENPLECQDGTWLTAEEASGLMEQLASGIEKS